MGVAKGCGASVSVGPMENSRSTTIGSRQDDSGAPPVTHCRWNLQSCADLDVTANALADAPRDQDRSIKASLTPGLLPYAFFIPLSFAFGRKRLDRDRFSHLSMSSIGRLSDVKPL